MELPPTSSADRPRGLTLLCPDAKDPFLQTVGRHIHGVMTTQRGGTKRRRARTANAASGICGGAIGRQRTKDSTEGSQHHAEEAKDGTTDWADVPHSELRTESRCPAGVERI